jgi:branched-chain amino acid transport system permease protein
VRLFLNYVILAFGTGSIYALLSLPMSLISSTTRIVDIGVGAYAAVAGLTAAALGFPFGDLLGALGGLLAAAVMGVLCGVAERRAVGNAEPVLVIGLVFLLMITAALGYFFGLDPRTATGITARLHPGGLNLPVFVLVSLAVMLLLLGVLLVVLYRTPVGRNMRSVASNPTGAALMGLNAPRYRLLAFASGGLLASAAGLLLVTSSGISYDSSLNLTLLGFGAFVICGIGGPVRAALGGLVIGVLQTMSIAYAPRLVATALPLMAILLILASGRFALTPSGARA